MVCKPKPITLFILNFYYHFSDKNTILMGWAFYVGITKKRVGMGYASYVGITKKTGDSL